MSNLSDYNQLPEGRKPIAKDDQYIATIEALKQDYNLDTLDRLLDGWRIVNSSIDNSIIGSESPASGVFTNLLVTNSVTFDSPDGSVTWDVDNNVFKVEACTELGNLKICDNTIRAINPESNVGNIILMPNSKGEININGPTNVYSTRGNFDIQMISGGTSIMTKTDISLNSSMGSIYLYSPNYVRLTSGSLLTFGDTCNSISNPIDTQELHIKSCSDVVVSSDSLTLDKTPLSFDTDNSTTITKTGDSLNITNESGDINITPAIPNGTVNIWGMANFGDGGLSNVSAIEYKLDRYTMGSLVTSGNPRTDISISLFSVIGAYQDVVGTMPSLNVPDGTFKVLVCNNMDTGCTYTIHFEKLITPNPPLLSSPPNSPPSQATKLIFKRQSQSAQLVYDAEDNAWILLTSGAYVE